MSIYQSTHDYDPVRGAPPPSEFCGGLDSPDNEVPPYDEAPAPMTAHHRHYHVWRPDPKRGSADRVPEAMTYGVAMHEARARNAGAPLALPRWMLSAVCTCDCAWDERSRP